MEWLNYHHLLNFWMVAQEGSIQRASEMLHVTPATISIQIHQLEKSLGVKLFRKHGRGLALTETGEQVAQYASEIFSTGRELMQMVKGRPLGRPIELRVGIRDVMPKLVAYRLLEPAVKANDAIKLICVEGEMSRLVADLAIHKLDMVLSDTALDPLFKVQAYSHLLGESHIVFVGSPSLAKRCRDNFPQSLDGMPTLLPTENSILRRSLDLWFHDEKIKPHIRGEFADSAMMKIAGAASMGLFPIPKSIQDEVEKMYRVELIGELPHIRESFYAVTVERKIKHPAVLAIQQAATKRSAFN